MLIGMTRIGAHTLQWVGRRQHPLWQILFKLGTRVQNKLVPSTFSRNVLTMLAGTVLGQATTVLLSPILTRLYSPEQFGVLSVYTSCLTILIVAACLRYEIPVATARTSAEAANLITLCAITLVCTTGAVAIVSVLIPRSALAALGLAGLDSYRLLLPVGFFVLGGYSIVSYGATWAQEFGSLARTRISQGVSGPVSQIIMGLLGFGSIGLALGFVIGQSAGTTFLFRSMIVRRWAMFRQVSIRQIRETAWSNRSFPLVSAWAGIIDTAGYGYLAYILVAVLYPGPIAGFMFLSERVVARPLTMIANSMLTVFMGEIGRLMIADPARLRRRFLQVTSRQLFVGGAWVALIDIIAEFAFAKIFGADWGTAVPYLVALSFAYLANSVVQSVTHTLQALRRQWLAATWQVGRVVTVVLVFVIC